PWVVACKRLADDLGKLAAADKGTRDKVEAVFVMPLKVMLDQVRLLLKAEPVSIKTLPPDLVSEWSTADGRFRVQAQPSGDPNDNDT
ncbi:hypothetical protein KC219_24370, partial [Mycobacterium tuberculosis]|nr:hypothetical protein [Mycobacterium tuberculosis]